jgi:putative alpha-1,2-mannosidase
VREDVSRRRETVRNGAAGPDTVSSGGHGSGYSAEMTTIEGFSFLHMSGVGCYGDLGNLQVLPQTGPLVLGRDEAKSPYRKETETAHAGHTPLIGCSF